MKIKFIQYIIAFAFIFSLGQFTRANSDSTCIAEFTYEIYEEIGKPSVIQFINESTGNPTQFFWDFGDGSIANVKDPIHYFPEDGQYQVKLTIANNISSDEVIKTIEIVVPLSIDFSFKLDSNNVVPNTFIFTGNIDGYYDHIIWNFGDQILLDIEDTIHSYAKQDHDYQVILTAQYSYNDTSILTKALAKGLTTSEYFDLGGQVYLGDSLMNNPSNDDDIGVAYLYRVDNDELVVVDTNIFSKLGYYWFDTQLKAHYLVQVSLTENSNHVLDFAPTYVGNTVNWDEAEIINLAQDKFREDVNLIPKTKITSGSKSLTGNVEDLIKTDKENEVIVYLFNTENELIDYHWYTSDMEYEFNDLEKGHYWVEADLTGVPSRPQLIYVDDSKETVFKSIDQSSEYSIFPNPASDYTLITLENNNDKAACEIQIFNSGGQLIKTTNHALKSGKNFIHLNLRDFPSGVLFVKTSSSGNKILKLIHY